MGSVCKLQQPVAVQHKVKLVEIDPVADPDDESAALH